MESISIVINTLTETETVLNGTTKTLVIRIESAGVTIATQTSVPFPSVTLRVFQLTVRCFKSQLRRERHVLKLLKFTPLSHSELHFCSSPNSSVMSHHISVNRLWHTRLLHVKPYLRLEWSLHMMTDCSLHESYVVFWENSSEV